MLLTFATRLTPPPSLCCSQSRCAPWWTLAIAWALIFCRVAIAGQGDPTPALQIESDVNDAGLVLHVVSVPHTPVVAIRVYVLGGVCAENERRGSGLAFTTLELLSDAWRAALDAAGPTGALAHISSALDYDALSFAAVTTRDHYPAVLRQLADVLARFRLTDDAWQRVRDRVSRRLLLDLNDHPYQLLNLYRRAAYFWHPVRTPLRGELSLFTHLSRDDLIAYYRQYFVAGNVVVVIAGEINPTEATALVEDAFAVLPHQTVALPPAYEEHYQGNERWLERRADVTQTYVCVGYLTVPEDHPDAAALDVLRYLLSRERSHMLRALNHDKFPVSDFSITIVPAGRARSSLLFTFRQDARVASTSAGALAAWLHQRAAQPWRTDDLRAAVESLLLDYRRQLADPVALAELVGHATLHSGNPFFPHTRAQRWLALTPADLRRVALTYLTSSHLTTVLIQPHDPLGERDQLLRSERALLSPAHYPIRRLVLDNGLTVLLRPNPNEPLVHIYFAAIGGGWCEDRNLPGAFAFLGAFLADAPSTHSPSSFDRLRHSLHITPRFTVHPQYVTLAADVSPPHTEAALTLLCDMWGLPNFSRTRHDRVLRHLKRQLAAQATDLPALADLLIRDALFQIQPYGANWLGTPDALARFTWRDAQQLWRQFCVPAASTLLVSGDFDEGRIEALIRSATRRWRPPTASEFFFDQSKKFAFHSEPPSMTVILPPEPAPTAAITRIYSSINSLSLIACGSQAPGLNATSAPPYLAELLRGALAVAFDSLRASWRDPDNLEIIRDGAAAAWAGHDTGWVYVWLAVPPQYTTEATRRLQTLFYTTLRALADGSLLPAARARAAFDAHLAHRQPDFTLNLILRNHLFGYDKRLPRSLENYLDACSPSDCSSFIETYARYPVTIIVTPE